MTCSYMFNSFLCVQLTMIALVHITSAVAEVAIAAGIVVAMPMKRKPF